MIKKLALSLREYKKDSILTPIYVIFEAVIDIIIPLLMANLIDYGIDEKNMNYVLKIGLLLLLGAFFAMFFGALSGKSAATASAGFAKNLRHDMYYRIQDFSFSNIDKFSTASIVTRLTTDVNNLQMAYQMILRVAIRSPAILIFSLVVAFRINKQLSMIFLAAIPILGVEIGRASCRERV